MDIPDYTDPAAGYIPSPYSTVGRSWAMICAPPGTEDSADDIDVVFAALALLCGNTLGHLAENVPKSTWYRLLRLAGQPAQAQASSAVARMVWWIYVNAGGDPGIADTLEPIIEPVQRRRLLEAVDLWHRDGDAKLASAARIVELFLLDVVAMDFQIRQLGDGDEAREEWVNAICNLTEIADLILHSDVRRGLLKRLYSAPTGVLS